MKFIFRYIILLISTLSIFYSYAQDGTPYITHFRESKEIESQNWSVCQDEQNVMLFANRKGIMRFDGQNWDLLKIPHIPFALGKNPIDNKVYVGANNNYGYLERDEKGIIQYLSLSSDTAELGIISKIIFSDSTIYFYGDQTITRYSLNDPAKFKRWKAKKGKSFTGILVTNKNTFFNVSGEGLYRLESDTLFPIVTGFYTENNEILFSLPYSKDRILVGTDDSKLYTFDGIKYYNYNINDEGYLKESILADGQIISDTLYAFGTLYGGVEIVNKRTGKIVYTINYQNGLPDDEIYSLGLDNNNGLWLTHQFGISRVDFNLPLRNYTTYPGLKGNLFYTVLHQGVLYVATNDGVYYLSEVKDYTEAEVWIKTRVKSNIAVKQEEEVTTTEEQKKPARKLFSRLFNKDESDEKEPAQTEKKPAPQTKTKTKYVRKTVSTLKSINHVYKKVENLNEKTTQLVSTENGLLAASNTGLYLIKNNKAEKIIGGKYINQISNKTHLDNYYIASNSGIFSIMNKNDKWIPEYNFVDFNDRVYTLTHVKKDKLWLGSENIAYSFTLDSLGLPQQMKRYLIKTDFPEQYKLDFINDTLFAFLESGLFYYNLARDSFLTYHSTKLNYENIKALNHQQGIAWLRADHSWFCLNDDKVWTKQEEAYLKLFDDITSINSDSSNNLWIINNNNQIYRIKHLKYNKLDPRFDVFFRQISNEKGISFELSDLTFDPDNKAIYVKIIAPSYVKQNSTHYQYFVEGLMNDWSEWFPNQDINLIVKSGTYTLHVRAKDIWGNKSEIKSLQFTIKPPFNESIWFYVIIGLVIVLAFILISKIREKKLRHDKRVLEKKVKERTIEIQEKAEEIEVQRDEIMGQRDEILRQKEEITDSINYARRIQNAVLPLKDHFKKSFSDHFILFKPRDIVSGDFYWIAEDENKLYFTAADCTGHGVPGAFMSMLGVSSLNEIFGNENHHLTAARMLNLLREKIKFSLHQTGKEGENKDGMDMALCIYHKKKKLLEYAGAYNPLYLIRDGKLQEYKADRMPIGIYHIEKESFTNHEINIKKGDAIYIFSDGYADQFGGPGQTKFKSGNLKKLLLEINEKPMEEQHQILDTRFMKWKGNLDQIDDVILIGIRF